MQNKEKNKKEVSSKRLVIRKCHCCDHVMESLQEMAKCENCLKPFLPLGYFEKIHETPLSEKVQRELFASAQELGDEDLIVGLYVLW